MLHRWRQSLIKFVTTVSSFYPLILNNLREVLNAFCLKGIWENIKYCEYLPNGIAESTTNRVVTWPSHEDNEKYPILIIDDGNPIIEVVVPVAVFFLLLLVVALIWPICRKHSQGSYHRFRLQWGADWRL